MTARLRPRGFRAVRRRGVTLIETLVVIALIALSAAVVVLNAPPARAGARAEAERFAARLDAAFAVAVSSGTPVRLDIDAAGYAFSVYADDARRPVERGAALAAARFDGAVAASVVKDDPAARNERARSDAKASEDGARSIVIDPLGGEAATFAFESDGARWLVKLDALGAVKVGRDAG